jgi:ABC-type transport system involved in cytochrome bd biosynthesis fused ATPase/permease subunit
MVNEAIRTTFLNNIDVIKNYFSGTLPTAFSNLATSGTYEIPYFIFDKESSLIFFKYS